jgi:hypothetical protein
MRVRSSLYLRFVYILFYLLPIYIYIALHFILEPNQMDHLRDHIFYTHQLPYMKSLNYSIRP